MLCVLQLGRWGDELKIVCTNKIGKSLTIQYAFPFYYVSCDGLMTYNADISTAVPYIPGEVYQGSHNPKRNIVISFAVRRKDYWNVRDQIYSVLGESGTLTWYPDSGEKRKIDFYTESIVLSDPNSRGFRFCSVSLICPFPFFTGSSNIVQMSRWTNNIFLPGMMQTPFTIGDRITGQIANIFNSQPINVGIIATFRANSGTVSTPKLQNLTTGEEFTLSATINPGEKIIVDTINGQKRVLNNEGEKSMNLWNYQNNSWIQLHPGENELRFDAVSGATYLDVSIEYSNMYIGG